MLLLLGIINIKEGGSSTNNDVTNTYQRRWYECHKNSDRYKGYSFDMDTYTFSFWNNKADGTK